MLLEYDPPLVPSVVLVVSAIVGPAEVLQQIPWTVTPAIQFPVIFPPEDAVVEVIPEISVVVIDGVTVLVVNGRSAP